MAKVNLQFKITGIDEMRQNIVGDFDKKMKEIDDELGATFLSIETMAKSMLKGKGDFYTELAASIASKKLKNGTYQVRANKFYAAYVEFGTGRYAASYVTQLDKDWQTYASKFIVNKKGRLPQTPFLHPSANYYLNTFAQRANIIMRRK